MTKVVKKPMSEKVFIYQTKSGAFG